MPGNGGADMFAGWWGILYLHDVEKIACPAVGLYHRGANFLIIK